MIQMDKSTLNATMRNFGAPHTIIHTFQHWSVMLRPAQATLGALVLSAHDPAKAFSQLSPASFTELHTVTKQLEAAMTEAFEYDKLNYLMLMMVDPDVHFHIIPRYAEAKNFADMEFIDAGWPAVPNLGQVNETDEKMNQLIIDHIKSCW